ncbi:MAG: glycine cleavage system protein R [SAR86 cluster bacterium]|uniref:Glycine cleavage system transcriptional repressor n=1 Tax=SAR86 cluster bacterium TaxID=2030880 RepID=A0A2A4MTS8_9GAMM|nr:MAG: glycine cleavage system protein R [SAR86 cluster bacterium]
MTSYLVLTIIGDDKPGLVESLSQTIADNNGNWLESQMSQLAGKFAGILRVSVSDANAEQLIEQLQQRCGSLKMQIERVSLASVAHKPTTLVLNLVANDRPGIIKEISAALAKLHVNVEKLHSECTNAPMSSEPLFKATVRLSMPEGLSLETLQTELENIADDLMVDINPNTEPG